jgi:FtsP/CotA-like multicopper oxidase with cupredoxin domain
VRRGVGYAPYPRRVDLIITGDLRDEDGQQAGAELWRVPFREWGETHRMLAETWCRPRRFTVIDGALVRADGRTNDPTVLPGEVFALEVAKPPPP